MRVCVWFWHLLVFPGANEELKDLRICMISIQFARFHLRRFKRKDLTKSQIQVIPTAAHTDHAERRVSIAFTKTFTISELTRPGAEPLPAALA